MQQLHAIRPLINNSNQVLWKLPEGKPNGKEPLVDKVNDQRTRVLQAKQKGKTCWYYATKRVRTNYGENCGDFKAEREFEKKFSEYRKQLTFIDEVEKKSLEFWIALLNKRDGSEVLKTAAPDVVIEIQQLLSKVTEWLSNSADTHFDHFKFFSNCSEPIPQEPIEGNPIWAWPQNSYNEKINDRHNIVVVGAEKLLNKQFVYFIDPTDASDPDNPATQKIYKVSYGRFVSAHSCPQSLVKVMEKDGYIHYNPNLPNFILT